ncbi:BFD domain protein (2Fe-2S)-binding domain protein [Aminomonas paucivorans DSM 12260]|uniref:BFD domain protein (2Fe-2S)-binding domain protein n=1 Tax=Aminomonas paucivorans DSM 12260 TaxID=584708 RepID=E3CXR6_9BACT|nr:(2Fe-2S)-binding protein [Aminomonas paucivorans]EFQ22659.1 BFD domain protein (2Fe-2S)-binding domain protein [Aminomonas paucivorans DSM 12260]
MSQVIQKGPVCDNEEVKQKQRDIVICRCEEITLGEIQDWIAKGYDTFDELKRVLRVGMGPCQGRGCQDIILREVARMTGRPVAQVPSGTVRPPVKPIKLGILAANQGKE